MPDVTERTLQKRIELDASPERVWRAITDPAELSQWFGDSAALDLRPGGDGHMTWESYGRHAMRVEVVDPPRHLVWSWVHEPEMSFDEGTVTRVEWTLSPREGGGTVLDLRETGFREETHFESNVSGWDTELEELRALVAGSGAV